MSDSAGNWCLIESDPGVFTELIREFGNFSVFDDDWQFWVYFLFTFEVMRIDTFFWLLFSFLFLLRLGCEGVQVEELWSLDAEQFKDLQ